MKSFLAALLVASSVVSASAQTPAAEPIKISDDEAIILIKTIEGYAQGNKQQIEVFDRKKGGIVKVRLDKVVTDNPDCVVFPQDGIAAICGECTEVVPAKDDETTDGDKYVIWFVVVRGSLPSAYVKETFVKSVNGKPMYAWAKDAEGKLTATLIPDEPAAP
jgi:hypothetical protein